MSEPFLAVVDYGIGNLRSAAKALQRCGADARLVDDPSSVAAAAGVVLPGVGAFGSCAAALRESGLEAATRAAATDGRPFLGICVGMQLLYDGSEESPGVAGLGVVPGRIRRLTAGAAGGSGAGAAGGSGAGAGGRSAGGVKLPQMQWNRLDLRGDGDLVRSLRSAAGAGGQPWVYFVHSYAAPAGDEVVATCDYGGTVTAAIQRGPLWATQFHPEKSGAVGLGLLAGFVAACAEAVPAGSRPPA